jgi:hypothetical protein
MPAACCSLLLLLPLSWVQTGKEKREKKKKKETGPLSSGNARRHFPFLRGSPPDMGIGNSAPVSNLHKNPISKRARIFFS